MSEDEALIDGRIQPSTMREAMQQVRAVADDAEAGRLTYDDIQARLFYALWPVQQEHDPTGHMADFKIRGALVEAMERDDPGWNYHHQDPQYGLTWHMRAHPDSIGPGVVDNTPENAIDNLGWALTRDGWYPPPHGLHQDSWNEGGWKPGDGREVPAWGPEPQPEPYSTGPAISPDTAAPRP